MSYFESDEYRESDDYYLYRRDAYKQNYKPDPEYDSYVSWTDKLMAKVPPPNPDPKIDPELREKIAAACRGSAGRPDKNELYRDRYRHQYVDDPEAYAKLLQSQLPNIAERIGLNPDILPLHDAVFYDSEDVQDIHHQELSYGNNEGPAWWEQDALAKEFADRPKPQDSVESKVDWYLRHAQEEQAKGSASSEDSGSTPEA